MPTTLADVAHRAGVSLATASRVISGSPRGVAAERRAAVLAAVAELDYVPNAHAQALARASTSTVGVIVHDVSDPYFSEITRGVQQAASEAGRLVMLCNTFRDPARELAYITLLRAQRVAALILAGSGLDDRDFSRNMAAQVDAFVAAGGRVALIGRHNVPGDAVLPDNAGGARELGRTLIALGHREFGVVSGPPLLTTTHDRLEGFQTALDEAGIALPPERIVNGDFSRDGGARAARRLLDHAPQITAIFALADTMAVGVLAALRERGVAVPDDVSVAGFDDIPITLDVTPALSTVRVRMVELGARAMLLALEPPASKLRIRHLPAKVVLRASTAPPREIPKRQ
jgi:LacI family transcriptional regulator